MAVMSAQEANLVEEGEDSPDFWSRPVQSYDSPVEHSFLIGLDWSTNGPLPDCDRKYIQSRKKRTIESCISFWEECR